MRRRFQAGSVTIADIKHWIDSAMNVNQGSVLLDALFDVVRRSAARDVCLCAHVVVWLCVVAKLTCVCILV